MKHLTTFSTLLLFLLGANSVFGADFQKGWDASKKGDYATALKEWRPLAEQGNANAQSNLGWMYDNGLGVLEDDKEEVKLYRLGNGSDLLPNKELRMPQGVDKNSPTAMDLPLELRSGLTSRDRWMIALGLVAVCALVWIFMVGHAATMVGMSGMGGDMKAGAELRNA